MVIQNIVFPDGVNPEESIYFHTDGKVSENNKTVLLKSGEYFSTFACMNLIDIGFWKKYTNVRDITLRLFAVGRGELKIYVINGSGTDVFKELEFTAGQMDIDLSDIEEGLVYFSLTAKEPSCFLRAFYSSEIREPNEVRLAVAAAGSEGNIARTLAALEGSAFFKEGGPLCGALKIYSEEGEALCQLFDTLLFRIRQEGFNPTHVIFMTGEADFYIEGLYRLYAFLSVVKDEFKDRPVSGAKDEAKAGSVSGAEGETEDGQVSGVEGGSEDKPVSGKAGLRNYAPWKLCAYPAGYALENRPFAFYKGEDGAEYGLRYGKEPVFVRGFETVCCLTESGRAPVEADDCSFKADSESSEAAGSSSEADGSFCEAGTDPEDIYYEVRSGFIIDMMEHYETDAFAVLRRWNERYKAYKAAGLSRERYCCALALWHASKPGIYRKNSGKAPARSFNILRKKRLLRPAAALLKGLAVPYIYIGYSFFRDRFVKIRREQLWQ